MTKKNFTFQKYFSRLFLSPNQSYAKKLGPKGPLNRFLSMSIPEAPYGRVKRIFSMTIMEHVSFSTHFKLLFSFDTATNKSFLLLISLVSKHNAALLPAQAPCLARNFNLLLESTLYYGALAHFYYNDIVIISALDP